MVKRVSKSQFKPKVLEYLREVEHTRRELVITNRGRPVLKIVPYSEDVGSILGELRSSVVRYDDPTEPVALEDWDALR